MSKYFLILNKLNISCLDIKYLGNIVSENEKQKTNWSMQFCFVYILYPSISFSKYKTSTTATIIIEMWNK